MFTEHLTTGKNGICATLTKPLVLGPLQKLRNEQLLNFSEEIDEKQSREKFLDAILHLNAIAIEI
jgi:hypothetical protein